MTSSREMLTPPKQSLAPFVRLSILNWADKSHRVEIGWRRRCVVLEADARSCQKVRGYPEALKAIQTEPKLKALPAAANCVESGQTVEG